MIRRLPLALVSTLILIAGSVPSLHAQEPRRVALDSFSIRLPVDLTKLAERADSFTVNIQGNPMGYQTTALVKTSAGYAYRTKMTLGPMMDQTTETSFAGDLTPLSVKASGQVQGQTLTSDITYANGRVRGISIVPAGGGPKTTMIDTTVASGVLDAHMIGALMPGLPLGPNAKFDVRVFDELTNRVIQLSLHVAGMESVAVPAGTFPVYRVEMSGLAQPITIFATTASPHRVVKLAPAGAPIEFVLVK